MTRPGAVLPQLRRVAVPMALACVLTPGVAAAQVTPRFILPGIDVQKRVNGVLSLMQYALVPDVTTSSLSINEAASGDPGLRFTQFGGGFTVSQSMPLYLEGNASYTRYDPTFVATSGSAGATPSGGVRAQLRKTAGRRAPSNRSRPGPAGPPA